MICKRVLYIVVNNYSEESSSTEEEEEPPIAEFAISFKYGVACQHVYPLDRRTLKDQRPGKPINENKEKDVTSTRSQSNRIPHSLAIREEVLTMPARPLTRQAVSSNLSRNPEPEPIVVATFRSTTSAEFLLLLLLFNFFCDEEEDWMMILCVAAMDLRAENCDLGTEMAEKEDVFAPTMVCIFNIEC